MKLSKTLTPRQFDNGYWYATELKRFAREIGVRGSSKLRKDQLEAIVRHFLSTGTITTPNAPPARPRGVRDSDRGLHPALPVVNYTNDKATKAFLLSRAKRMDPGFKLQSGTRYSLNRWREEQVAAGREITYGDLVRHFVDLNRGPRTPLRTEHGRYNNFVADFMKDNPGASHERMLKAWHELKTLDAPKTYTAWKRNRISTSPRKRR